MISYELFILRFQKTIRWSIDVPIFIILNLLLIWITPRIQKMNKWIWNPFHNIHFICSNISLRLIIHLQVLTTAKTALSPLCTYITAKNYMIMRQRNECKILNYVTLKYFISNTNSKLKYKNNWLLLHIAFMIRNKQQFNWYHYGQLVAN